MALYKRLKTSQTADASNENNRNGNLKPPHKMYSNLMIQQLLFNEYILPTQINGEDTLQDAQAEDGCTKTFKTKSVLESHYISHKDEKPYICDICSKGFTQRISLQTHYLTHSGDKPHTCKVCYKDFTDKSTLRKHCLIHTGERPHTCDICHKSFTQKITLKKHYLIHTGEKNHTCEICNKSFAQKSTLSTHYLVHSSNRKRKRKSKFMPMLNSTEEMHTLKDTTEEEEKLLLPEVEVQLVEGMEGQLLEQEQLQEKTVVQEIVIEFPNEENAQSNDCLNDTELNRATVLINSCGENKFHETNNTIKDEVHNKDINERKLHVSEIPKGATFDEIAKICPKAIAMIVNQSSDFRVATIEFDTEEDTLECFNACEDVKIGGKCVTVSYPTRKEKKHQKKSSRENNTMHHPNKIKQEPGFLNEEETVVIKKEVPDVMTEKPSS